MGLPVSRVRRRRRSRRHRYWNLYPGARFASESYSCENGVAAPFWAECDRDAADAASFGRLVVTFHLQLFAQMLAFSPQIFQLGLGLGGSLFVRRLLDAFGCLSHTLRTEDLRSAFKGVSRNCSVGVLAGGQCLGELL